VTSSEGSISQSYPHVKFDGEDLGHNGPSMVVDACVITSGVVGHTELTQTTDDEVVHVVSGLEPGDAR
jgi:hypothetical protein